MSHLELVAVIVDEYDPAIPFFVDVLGFELVEDSPALSNDGRPKRWVVVRPSGAQTGILLARADGEDQRAAVGNQLAGRVGFFLRVEDFDAAYERMAAASVKFVTVPRTEPYGRVAVFERHRRQLLGPPRPRLTSQAIRGEDRSAREESGQLRAGPPDGLSRPSAPCPPQTHPSRRSRSRRPAT